ncbi:MAG: diaminopimelate epimerase [Candidatus Omnitrophica bacterium]|nr:diaminopimelate epimerase [Candidatus Omnitrophota bacterium]
MINFSKMVATGNDFIVIDNRLSVLGQRLSSVAKRLCDRKTGIGADGFLVVERSRSADFRMRIFNPDGSEPDMCGNGSRCIALYARDRQIAASSMVIQTGAGLLRASVRPAGVRINTTQPYDLKMSLTVKHSGKPYTLHHINTGVPHAVCFADDVDGMDMISFGRSIRYNNIFLPDGVNVNAARVKRGPSLQVRTYERGVESETRACGTGSIACALIASLVKKLKSPVRIYTRGGELTVYFKYRDNKFYDVFLEGPAEEVFTGRIKL